MLKLFILTLFVSAAHAEEFEVLPHTGEGPRGLFWIADGPAHISADNTAVTNRLRLGLALQFGKDQRFNAGFTVIDSFSSGEKSDEVGSIRRSGSGFHFGYYVLPERLMLNYMFNSQSVRGSRVTGPIGAVGHQVGALYRIYTGEATTWGIELSYLNVGEESVPVFDVGTNATQIATYPEAKIWTLSLVVGLGFI